MSAPSLQPMSVEEYLRTEETSPVKREYVGGFVYPLHGQARAQAGTTAGHAQICSNILAALHGPARAQGCRVYVADMKLRVEHSSAFYYPDVMVVCRPHLPEMNATFVTAPCLLMEVTSKSTVQNDRLAKYTALPGLRAYLIVSQHERRVYAYRQGGGTWTLQELSGSDRIDLPCVGYSLNLDEIYMDVPL